MVDSRFFMPVGALSLGELARTGAVSDQNIPRSWNSLKIRGAHDLDQAGADEISLAASRKYTQKLEVTRAGAVVVAKDLAEFVPSSSVGIIVDNPHLVFVRMLEYLYPTAAHRLAIAPDIEALGAPKLEPGVLVAKGAVIGSGATIGKGSRIGPGSVIGPNVTIGRHVDIGANVTIECALIGDDVTINAGVCIGGEGFGWLDHGKSNIKIPQLGRVIIQSGASIGANATIDRGALSDTVIGELTKIDNLVQIGHNCTIGRACLIAATTGLSGGTHVGDGVLMGGGVGSSGHLSIGANSVVHGRAAVTKDWPDGSMLAGAPAQDIKDFWRELAVVRRLAKGGKR